MPVVYDQPGSFPSNSGTIDGGATIAATGVTFTNTDSGRIYGGVTFTAGGSLLVNQLGGWIGNSSNVITGPLIVGSDGDDRIVNGGVIAGLVSLGGGDDVFVARSLSTGLVDFGSGNDIFRVEETNPRFIDAVGGDGVDRLVFASDAGQFWAGSITGFEQLVFENGGNFSDLSGFQSIAIGVTSNRWPFVNLMNCFNPLVDLDMHGSWLMLRNSTLHSVTGDDNAQAVELLAGGIVSNGISLGGGDDAIVLNSFTDAGAPGLTSTVTGGAGTDTIRLTWYSTGDRSYDLSLATGFEKLDVNASSGTDGVSTAHVSHVAGVTTIDVGRNAMLILSASDVSSARVNANFGGGLTLSAGVAIDRYGLPEDAGWDQRLDIAQGNPLSSATIINHGSIAHDVRFYIGDDLYDGRDGTVGGTVYGNAGNDRLLGGSGAEIFIGGYGADTLQGGGGADTLTGGAGYDLFTDTASGHNGDTITDFSRGDRLVFSDAVLEGFNFSLSGNVLSYAGGSLVLQGVQNTSFAVARAAEGGVELTFSVPPIVIAAGAAAFANESFGVAKASAELLPATLDTMPVSARDDFMHHAAHSVRHLIAELDVTTDAFAFA